MNYRKFLPIVLLMAIFMFSSSLKAIANNKAISWFVLISDTHIGYNNTCKENLSWIVNDAYDTINPITIINAGDLTEQSLITKDNQEEQQWIDYRQILDNANMDVEVDGIPVYADIPGNHDLWNDSVPLANYLKYSVQGTAQNDWLYILPYGVCFQFIMTDTTDKDNVNFATDATKCLGELDAVELDFIENALKDMNSYFDLSFVFGHHSLNPKGWGKVEGGQNDCLQLFSNYNISFYGYGHTHKDHFDDPYYLNSKTLMYNVKSLGKDSRYAIVAVDYGYISVTEAEVDKWPVVLITYPLDRELGANDKLKTYNPFAQPILTQKSNRIRFLIFSREAVHTDDVEVRYKEDKFTKRFKSIPDIARDLSLNGKNSYLWVANWDTNNLKPGDYLIRVDAGNAFDQISVKIETFLDVVLVIDCSGSMWGSTYPTKMDSAKLSAQMFVGSMNENDKIGIVEFSNTASDIFSLTKITGDNIKTEAKNAISALYANGGTSIGAGLRAGQKQLTDYGTDDPAWVMVLLSDGHEGNLPMTKDVLPDIIGTKTKIYTIGLGEPDESLLGTIAWTTGGFYRYCANAEDLMAVYQAIQNSVAGLQTIVEEIGNIIQGAKKIFTIFVDPVSKAIFKATIGGSDIDLILIDPNGNEINPTVAATDPSITYISGTAHKIYIVKSPQPGGWGMKVTGTNVAPGGEPIAVSVSADTDVFLSLEFDRIEYVPDGKIGVIAGLDDSLGPILGATVTADIQTPFGDTNLSLYDDGLHGDRAADDGIYANFFNNTNQQGNYTFKIDAAGTSNEGNPFTRTATKSTVVGQDTDGDGMADTWEDIYGLNPSVDDSAQDPDGDGLTNLEEYSYRTNPQNLDTDNDGYSDKEEVDLGSDPLDFDDVPIFVTALCKDISVQLDENANAVISADQVDNGSTAINGVDTISVSPNSFYTDDIGDNLVTLTVMDVQGNIDECTATVTVTAYSPSTKKNDDTCFISFISTISAH